MDLPGTTEPVHVYEYNSRGLKTQEDPGRPEEIRWTYDAAGRVQRVEYPSDTRVDSTYTGDGVSSFTTASLLENGTLQKVEVRKNLRGWVTSEAWEIDGVRYEIRYAYDDAGNRTSMTYPDGTTVNFAYNERNQLVRIPGFFEGPAAGVWTDNAGFRYDVNGFLIGMRSMNGIETTFQPDERNRLKQISSIPLTLTYTYTPGGNVASITDASNGTPFTTAYGYDGVNRLVSAQVHMPTGIETVQYRYDALGNRIKEAWTDARGAIDSSYLPGNYLVQRGSTSYSWGTYGQLILKDDQPTALGGETNYDYNARRLMTRVRVNGSPVAQFVYDAYGRRVKIVEGDTTTLTLYSGNDIVYEVKTQPGQPTVTTKYLAVGGKYLAKVVQEGTNSPQTYFYHVDLVGSVRAITDSQGQVVARFEYEPFGVTTSASGPLASSPQAGGETHKFTGKPEDAAIGLYYFNARYYDPRVGRFAQVDMAGQDLNSYPYCGSNPLNRGDPDGLWYGIIRSYSQAEGVVTVWYELHFVNDKILEGMTVSRVLASGASLYHSLAGLPLLGMVEVGTYAQYGTTEPWAVPAGYLLAENRLAADYGLPALKRTALEAGASQSAEWMAARVIGEVAGASVAGLSFAYDIVTATSNYNAWAGVTANDGLIADALIKLGLIDDYSWVTADPEQFLKVGAWASYFQLAIDRMGIASVDDLIYLYYQSNG